MYNVEPIKADKLKLLVIMDIGYSKKKKKTQKHFMQMATVTQKCQTANVNPTKWKAKEGCCEKAQGHTVVFSHHIMPFPLLQPGQQQDLHNTHFLLGNLQ